MIYGLSSISSLAPFHLLTYGSILGTEVYQTFLMTGLSHRALPKAQFRTLQKSVFPAYFDLQLLLTALLAATHPPASLSSLARSREAVLSIGLMLVTSTLNWAVYGPRTLRAMVDQTHQETRDGRRLGDAVRSDEMKAVMRRFSKAHAMSIHLNLITILSTVWYSFILVSNLSCLGTSDLTK